jgi:UDPglucose--hexose-1-phosphate uridylyltransferase
LPELRKDPVTGRWVIIATDRARRPTDFTRHTVIMKGGFCPFCPGQESKTPPEILAYRNGHGSERDKAGWSVRVVPNKYPALGIEGDLDRRPEGIYDRMNGIGAHEVIIETPAHNQTFATMGEKQIADVLWSFRDRIIDLKQDRRFRYILIFKNHGEPAGATLEHPHSQLIALPIIPRQVSDELEGSSEYHRMKERCIFCDILHQELADQSRVVAENDSFVTLSPYAPRFPFETCILPRTHNSTFETASAREFEGLAQMLKLVVGKMDAALERPAFNMVLHTAPLSHPQSAESYHWHIEMIPKLTKIAGFEWGTGFYINPTSPEEAARYLREAVVDVPELVTT